MTVLEIIKNFCNTHYPNADGVCKEDCGCSFDDFAPCGADCSECELAKFNVTTEEFEVLENKGD